MGSKFSKSNNSSSSKSKGNNNNNKLPEKVTGKKGKRSKVTDQDKAILELKKTRDVLKRFLKNIQFNSDKEFEQIKSLLVQGKKERAKLLLKKKRVREILVDRTHSQLDQIQEISQTLEFAQIKMSVLESLKEGNEALKRIFEQMISIEEIEKLVNETRDGIEKQNEINHMLNYHLTTKDLQDVELELADILHTQRSTVEQNHPFKSRLDSKIDRHLKFPDVPKNVPISDESASVETLEVTVSNLAFPQIPDSAFPSTTASAQRLRFPDVPKSNLRKTQRKIMDAD